MSKNRSLLRACSTLPASGNWNAANLTLNLVQLVPP